MNNRNDSVFSINLYLKRRAMGVTQEYMANKLKVSRSAYGRWEKGAAQPATDFIILIAKILHIGVADLFNEEVAIRYGVAVPELQDV